jgi:hypothetical protein
VLASALAGLVLMLRRRRHSPAALVFGAWVAAWLALSALGIFSALTLRANLAATPAFILLSAVTLGSLAATSRAGTVAAVALFLLLAWDGWQIGLRCLDLSAGS